MKFAQISKQKQTQELDISLDWDLEMWNFARFKNSLTCLTDWFKILVLNAIHPYKLTVKISAWVAILEPASNTTSCNLGRELNHERSCDDIFWSQFYWKQFDAIATCSKGVSYDSTAVFVSSYLHSCICRLNLFSYLLIFYFISL